MLKLVAGAGAAIVAAVSLAAEIPVYEARVKGLGAFELTLAGADEKPCVAIGWTRDNGTQYDEHRAVKYAERDTMKTVDEKDL